MIAAFNDVMVGMMTSSRDSLYTGICTVTCDSSPIVRFGAIPEKYFDLPLHWRTGPKI